MKVWVDLANTPQVLVLKPVIEKLEAGGHEVTVTMRDFAQTVEVAQRLGVKGRVINRQPKGDTRASKLASLTGRVVDLRRFAKGREFDVALSHNSYAQVVAARSSRIKTVTMMDYEGQPANHLAFRLANRVIVPEAFPAEDLRRFGARASKLTTFPGFKEQLYLCDFQSTDIEAELVDTCAPALTPGWRDRPLVVIRPPASTALYHRFENTVYPKLLERLGSSDVQVVAIPRSASQIDLIKSHIPDVAIPQRAVDGPSLVALADLVISAGGTMNREAAVLGTPTYSMFAGEMPAVDRSLMSMGRLKGLASAEEIAQLSLTKKHPLPAMNGSDVMGAVLSAIGTY